MTSCDPVDSKLPTLDARDAEELAALLLRLQPGYVPEWQPAASSRGTAVARIAARYLESILQRLNQAPRKNLLAFLDLLGVQLIPPRPARAPVVFQLPENTTDINLPAGTRLAAPPPPESTDQIVFETERATGVAVARLKQVFSLWPGRDQYIDHSTAVESKEPFVLFEKRALQDIPHHLYLAHDTLLALAGKSRLDVAFELVTASSEHLSLIWEYWDGQVWREFHGMRPACSQEEARRLDSTDGMHRNGRFRLETDCAETEATEVNGVEAFWVRARLDEPLPPNPAQILPLVESIQLSTQIAQPLTFDWAATTKITDRPTQDGPSICEQGIPMTDTFPNVCITVQDADEVPLRGVTVEVPVAIPSGDQLTDSNGQAAFSVSSTTTDQKSAVAVVASQEYTERFTVPPQNKQQEITFTLTVDGLPADQAFNDGIELDVSKPFFPFGQQPQPGTALYFTNTEIFSKPGARFQVYVQPAKTPQDELNLTTAGTQTALAHTVSWEYWDGRAWKSLDHYTNNPSNRANLSPKDFSGTGVIDLTVPNDMAPVVVNNQEGLWMRVRLLNGGYGYRNSIQFDSNGVPNEVTYVVPQPPSVGKFLLGYAWQYGPFHPEHGFAYNDFQYVDRTEEAKWEGGSFEPFLPSSDPTPALYLGFDRDLPVDRLGIYVDVEEERGETRGPALVWEYWDGFAWKEIIVDDETRHLRVPGLAAFIGPDDAQALARFGTPMYWLRTRLKEDGPPGAPTLRAIYPNAVWAVQHETIVDEPMGASTGRSNQVFPFRRVPVLEDEHVEVRELAGLRANVEWRILARAIFGADRLALKRMEAWLASEGRADTFVEGDLRLVRDRLKRVSEAWVRWRPQRHLFSSGPEDRHYVLERTTGKLFFGDGRQGRIPPEGARIIARLYRTGGGQSGNVGGGKISQLLSPASAVEAVFNPVSAEGGADGETVQAFARRGPRSLAHRGRGISPRDLETLAREASASVAVARAVPTRDPGGHVMPGWVTLIVIPSSSDPQPWPSYGLREQVRRYIDARGPADVVTAGGLYVTGPYYQPVDVHATVVPIDPDEAGVVERRAQAALSSFLHPLTGGPAGQGWEAGRGVYLSDVAAELERVAGIDYVAELALLVDGRLHGESVPVRPDRIVVAGEIRIKVLQTEG